MQDFKLDSAVYQELERRLETEGPAVAVDRLCEVLKEKKDYNNLFYAMLMKRRWELGVSPIPTSASSHLPAEFHDAYEDAIRETSRTVGQLFLEEGDVSGAWMYYRMIGEPEKVAAALEEFSLNPDEEDEGEKLDQVVMIAFQEGVNPRKGFDLILDNYGLCNAITTLGGHNFPHGDEVRNHCIRRVIKALYGELQERLIHEVAAVEEKTPPENTPVKELVQGRFYLFGEDIYHVDVSHLASVVQLSIHLEPGEELRLARELCEYGQRLSPGLRFDSEPPFDKLYEDHAIYLDVLNGEKIEEGLAHFRQKIEENEPDEFGSFAAEVLVNLLLRVGRNEEALDVASRYLVNVDERQLSCPGVVELCERTGNYKRLAELAKEHENAVHFLAGLIADKHKPAKV